MNKTISIKTLTQGALWTLVGALIAGILALMLSVSPAFAGGPANRPTFTSKEPADYVVFNAITDNPEHGDERNFVLIREAGVGTYSNEIKLQPGKEYEVYSYFHNNAKSRLNTGEGKGIARNVRMAADVPTVVKPGERGKITTTITSDNANPAKVWDEAYVTTDSTIALRFVPASAVIHSGGAVKGSKLPSTLFSSTGTFIGYNGLDGVLPGCADFAGYVIYRLKVDQPNFEAKKEVAPAGTVNWSKDAKIKPSGTVDFKITYKNTGTTDQTNVTIKDVLPKGLTYVAGSTKLTNTANPNGLKVSDNIAKDGINIGNYGPGATATVVFSAKIGDAKEYKCGSNTLTNKASVITSNGTKDDTATVTTDVECQPNECKPGVPSGDLRCEERCVPKDGETVNDKGECVPAALPTTGPAQIIAGILGVALVTLGFAYWMRSRKAYKRALAGFTEDFQEAPHEELLVAKTESHESHDTHASNFHIKK